MAFDVDTPCRASPDCLTCPLPQCKYDNWTAYQRFVKELDHPLFEGCVPEVMTVALVEAEARRQGVTPRTIFRRLARLR